MKQIAKSLTLQCALVLLCTPPFLWGQSGEGQWRFTSSLWSAKGCPAAALSGKYLYVIGGQTASGAKLNAVERAQILDDGSLGKVDY